MQKQLANGLILRSLSEGIASDRAGLPDFYASVNTEGESAHVQEGMRQWTRAAMTEHPTMTPDDIWVVVDPTKDDLIVSATVLIPQAWSYDGIEIPVGRPEMVGTHQHYRSRGLVRALFEVAHERSAALDHLLLGITGIPYFYRQFGYTMAVDLDQHVIFQMYALAEAAADYKPAYTLRPATVDDIPAIQAWHAYFAHDRLLTDVFSHELLRYEIAGRAPGYYPHAVMQVIENDEGVGVGYIVLLDALPDPYRLRCPIYVVGDQASYLQTFQDVMQGIKQWAKAHYGRVPESLAFGSGIHNTLEEMIRDTYGGAIESKQYAWYVRVPDTIRFLKHIAPVLERRLEGSGANRFTGELRVGFYNLAGISIQFARGRLCDIVPITGKDSYDVEFPWHMFWNVVFGHHTAAELGAILPDVWPNAKAAVLLGILFPKKRSFLIGLM